MKIYSVLHHEHVQVLRLLDRAHRAEGQKRRALLDELLDELTAHSRAEEEVFYDRLSDTPGVHALMLTAKEEHLVAARLMADLQVIDVADERCAAKIGVLADSLRHHIEQEEGPLFSFGRQLFDDVIAANFAGEYLAAKGAALQIPIEDRLIEALAMDRFGGASIRLDSGEWAIDDHSFKTLTEEPTANGHLRVSTNS